MDKRLKAFTIMEVLIVVILVGVVAAFAIPNYNKGLEKSDEREAVSNLRLIAQALEVYNFRNRQYPSANMPQVSDINTTLDLGILERNVDYSCTTPGANVRCTGTSNYGWGVRYTTPLDSNSVICHTGGCPSCPANGCSYAGMF